MRRGKAGAIAHGSGAVIETHARLETIFPAVLKPLPLPLRERPQRFSLYFSVDSIDVSVRRLNKHPPETMNARLVVFQCLSDVFERPQIRPLPAISRGTRGRRKCSENTLRIFPPLACIILRSFACQRDAAYSQFVLGVIWGNHE